MINKHKMAKHFDLDITDTAFSFARKTAEIAAEAATDGVYVIRTSLPKETFDDAATVRSYKSLAFVERAFRCIKTVDLHVRPVYHRLADRVRAHVFLCMLAYYLEWHMRQRLWPCGCVHEFWPTCADEYWPTLRGLICYAGPAGRSRSASLLCLSLHVLLALRCAVVRRNR